MTDHGRRVASELVSEALSKVGDLKRDSSIYRAAAYVKDFERMIEDVRNNLHEASVEERPQYEKFLGECDSAVELVHLMLNKINE